MYVLKIIFKNFSDFLSMEKKGQSDRVKKDFTVQPNITLQCKTLFYYYLQSLSTVQILKIQ